MVHPLKVLQLKVSLRSCRLFCFNLLGNWLTLERRQDTEAWGCWARGCVWCVLSGVTLFILRAIGRVKQKRRRSLFVSGPEDNEHLVDASKYDRRILIFCAVKRRTGTHRQFLRSPGYASGILKADAITGGYQFNGTLIFNGISDVYPVPWILRTANFLKSWILKNDVLSVCGEETEILIVIP